MPAQQPTKNPAWLIGWIVALLAGATVMYALTDDPRITHSSALNAVFDTRWMVAATRLVVIVLGLYLVASVAVRVRRGEWAKSVGPIDSQTQEEAQTLSEAQQAVQQRLAAAQETISDLTYRLKVSDDLIRQLNVRGAELGGTTSERPTKGGGSDA
jgi:hypothetical protein